jgi:mannose-6-phosphate isomerase-like protein (cupin superfamily)
MVCARRIDSTFKALVGLQAPSRVAISTVMMKPVCIIALGCILTTATVSRAEEPVFRGDIVKLTERNTDFRHVLFTGRNVQVVAMALPPGEDIGAEVHKVDQCFFFVQGSGQAIIEGSNASVGKDGVLCVPAGTRHNIRNAGREPLKLYTTYSPPQHPPGTVHHTKAEAQRAEESATPQ